MGEAIERAARLSLAPDLILRVFDTNSSGEGARRAMTQVATFQPDIAIGPASSDEAGAVTFSVPALTLSNDDSLQSAGFFVMGVTARQSTGAVLSYARKAGVKTFVLVRSGSGWSVRCEAAARTAADALGMRLLASIDLPAGDVVAALRAASGGESPNAVLLPDVGSSLTGFAGSIRAAGLQILGTSGWSSADIALPEVTGAWIAAPSPQASARFSVAYAGRYGEAPGMIAGLAYDAMLASITLARARDVSHAGLTRPEGFSGVTGMFRFTADKRAERRLAILVASREGGRPIEGEAMAWT